jgi:hypothetical protein
MKDNVAASWNWDAFLTAAVYIEKNYQGFIGYI